jgi:signal transduction histidine kinase
MEMALAALMERVTNFLPQPDPAMQKRIERSMPLRAELLHQIRSVWVVLLACQGAALLWLKVTPLQFVMATAFPALFLLFAFSKLKPFASAQLFVSIVLALTMTMGFHPYPQAGGTGVLTIILAGLLVGEFFVGIWTFVISVGLLTTITGTSDWRVNLGWAAVNLVAGWLVILFSRNLERLLDANFTAEEQQRGAIVEERTRFAREIHDTLAQGFTGIMMQLNAAEQRLPPGSESLGYIETARGLAQESLDQARRSVSALRMGVLANSTLFDAIEQIGRQMVAESKVKFETRLEGAPLPLPEPREANLLRIAQEALTNAVRHSGADRIAVRVAYKQGSVVLEIEDNGRGMADHAERGFGVDGIQERVRQLGGQLDIRTQPDRGTRFVVIVPNA